MKEYKVRKKEVETMNIQEALDYLDVKAIEYQNKAIEYKDKKTDEYDAPLREYWSNMAAYTGMQKLIEQLTDSDTKIL